MPKPIHSSLTRRERQIMDVLYRLGRATVGDVMEQLSGNPNYSTVRTQLRVLEEKGHVHHEEHGLRYVYTPAVPRSSARKSALRHLVDTFFDGSTEGAVAALLGGEGTKLSDQELDRIADLVKQSKAGRAGQAGGAGKAGKGGRE
jgi:predicted transcriptional regulator